MATLSQAEKVYIRQHAAKKAEQTGIAIHWIKDALHDSAQAVEDILASSTFETQVSNAIDAAASSYGVTFTAAQKRWIAALVMRIKAERDLA